MSFDKINELAGKIGMQSHYVPEWDLTIFFKPVRPKENAVAKKMVNDDDPLVYLNVALVNVKALNDDGSKMFKPEQYGRMLEWPFQEAFNTLADKMRKAAPAAEVKE